MVREGDGSDSQMRELRAEIQEALGKQDKATEIRGAVWQISEGLNDAANYRKWKGEEVGWI